MTVQEFNELKILRKSDKKASEEFCLICLALIKKCLLARVGNHAMESLSHSVLVKFMGSVTDNYIPYPYAYINKSVKNYLSNLDEKKKREVGITQEIAYEQRFEDLEKTELMQILERKLGKTDARLIYMHYVEGIRELELAKKFNIPYASVRQRICRAKKKLKKELGENVTKTILD